MFFFIFFFSFSFGFCILHFAVFCIQCGCIYLPFVLGIILFCSLWVCCSERHVVFFYPFFSRCLIMYMYVVTKRCLVFYMWNVLVSRCYLLTADSGLICCYPSMAQHLDHVVELLSRRGMLLDLAVDLSDPATRPVKACCLGAGTCEGLSS